MNEWQQLQTEISKALDDSTFAKITISKPFKKSQDLQNVYVRKVIINNEELLSFTFRYTTNDQTKNFNFAVAAIELEKIKTDFSIVTFLSTNNDFVFQASKKGKTSLRKLKPSQTNTPELAHDRTKQKRAHSTAPYLFKLGVTDETGNVIPKMADKYRQINKYLEIIESLLKEATLPDTVNIVDMGSGKGYLTFALYDYLVNERKLNVNITGIELRLELVDYCNGVAKQLAYTNLQFVCQPIELYDNNKIDILIALHACDTATDDAIFKGISANAAIIVCAPCCHKQIRQQVKGLEQKSPMLKYGIFKERQFEMVTDTIRALLLEKNQYESKVFEFISNEHTRKNVMLIGVKSSKKVDETYDQSIQSLKDSFQIEEHYLEKLLK